MHYASVEHIPETGDDSGVFLEYTSQPQPKTAGVLLLGTAGQIPAHSTTFFETACEIEEPRDIHPFAFRVHTHALGELTRGFENSHSYYPLFHFGLKPRWYNRKIQILYTPSTTVWSLQLN